MPRLSIDLNPQEHQQLKAMAALKGQSIKDYVLSRTLSDLPGSAGLSDQDALQALKTLLAPRIAEAEAGHTIALTPEETKHRARTRYKQGIE